MIEKFTKEEIEVLKKELAEMPKDIQKRTLCHEAFMRLHKTFKKRPNYDGVYHYEMTDAMLCVIDNSLANYELRPRNNNKYRRAVFVNKELADEYLEMANELVDVVIKHCHERMKGDNHE